ncbi:hypothetical protein BEL04_02130 [Mucilaginibacter sp. PPCGB 2223]|uniref:hypothetical protein n=1 Tax=Mucilaginibacter sp. PPCGB 2223 TaxID=1886027 RepID=UPI000824AB55|nr:hypothetical protein [Mucilaginibacter sp. PPCGB 2223]OCX53135.1 hypothetical protein BEL04_02130 [Mucilaginibacter sp. PPCGB 2223]
MKNHSEITDNKSQPEKKVWQPMTLVLISQGNINSGPTAAHNEASFTFKSSNPAHTKKYGYVKGVPHAATFTFSHLQHS